MFSFSISLLPPQRFSSTPILQPPTLVPKQKIKSYTTQKTYPTQKPYFHTLKRHITPITSLKETDAEVFCQKMKPTTVVVTSFFGGTEGTGTKGSGTLLNEDGFILSCGHLFCKEKKKLQDIEVNLSNGETFSARLVALDMGKDLALIEILQEEGLAAIQEGKERKKFSFAQLGDAMNVNDGIEIFSISNMCGQAFSFSDGRVSCSARFAADVAKFCQKPNYLDKNTMMIQTTLLSGPGSAGGPLFNSAGEVIGMLSSIVFGGMTYAIHGIEATEFLSKYGLSQSMASSTHGTEAT